MDQEALFGDESLWSGITNCCERFWRKQWGADFLKRGGLKDRTLILTSQHHILLLPWFRLIGCSFARMV
jgi:hypothetical protein